jgi:hypothetical protein
MSLEFTGELWWDVLKYLLFLFDCSVVKQKPTKGSKDGVSHAKF